MKLPTLHIDCIEKRHPEIRRLYGALDKISLDDLFAGGLPVTLKPLLGHDYSGALVGFKNAYMFKATGQHVYGVGPKMAEALCRTPLTEIGPDSLVMPQRCFYFSLPDCPWVIWGGERTRLHNLVGFYMYRASVPLVTLANAGRVWEVDPSEWGRLPRVDKLMLWLHASDGEATYKHPLTLLAGHSLEESVLASRAECLAIPDETNCTEEERSTLADSFENVVRLAVNVTLYMQSHNADLSVGDTQDGRRELEAKLKRTKTASRRKKIERRLAKIPRRLVTYIGPKLEAAAQALASASREGGPQASPRAHLVRAHWHRYRTGPGRKKVSLRWVNVFSRGSGKPERSITKFREPIE